MISYRAYKQKLYNSYSRNKKLYREIEEYAKVWNCCVAIHKRFYSLYKKHLSLHKLQNHITKIKKQKKYKYMRSLNAQAIQDIVERIELGYQKFFRDKKLGRKSSIPKFKKYKNYKSFTLKQNGYKFINDNKIRVGKQVYKYSKNQEMEGEIKTVTIKRDAVGDLYIIVVCKVDIPKVIPHTGKSVGYDFGLKTFLTSSNCDDIVSPLFFKENIDKIKKLNKNLSRKKKGSNNYKKAKIKLAKLHRKISNQRKDFHYKIAYEICEKYATICIENLNLKGMQRLYGRKINDLGFYQFVQILEHVASKCGCEVKKADRFYASSQICCCCGYQNKNVKDLRVREWECENCHVSHDRDRNAAINILNACI